MLFERLEVLADDLLPVKLASPVGSWVALWSTSEEGLISLSYAGSDQAKLDSLPPTPLASAWEEYWSGGVPSLKLIGYPRPFDLKVYKAVVDIPWGALVTYGDLAKRLGTSPRAVGSALRRNPWPLFVPCHRVVGKRGLGGYMGAEGVELKRALVEIEALASRGYHRP